jgi:hypothetical protein
MRATNGGLLAPLSDCEIVIPGAGIIHPRILPELSDQKGANYVDEPVMGRSSPPQIYSYSEKRVFGITLHFFAETSKQSLENLKELRWIQSALYPRSDSGSAPFAPPPICTIKCGRIFADAPLCVILKNYSVKYPTDVPWDETTYLPIKFDVDTSWEVVYKVTSLPGAEKIITSGG